METAVSSETKEFVSVLQRALFYESQYRNAIVSDAISFYDVNLTKDLLETDIFYKDSEGKFFSTLERVGLTAPCSFTDFVDAWVHQMINPLVAAKFSFFKNVRKELLDAFDKGKRDYIVEYWADVSPEKRIFINQRYLLTQNEKGDICALSIVKDFTDRETKQEENRKKELEQFAYYDPVTHGYNYIKFKEKLRQQAEPGSIISVDIHSFKIINSISGILRGDQVIEQIWNGIISVLKLDNKELAGHINADHFIVFIPEFDEKLIARKLNNITYACRFISSEMNVPQLEPYFGVSKWEPGKKIEQAYSEAVAAKTNAKTMTKQNYAFFNESDTQRLIKEKQIIDSFESAIIRKEFKIFYQPKYNPVNKKLVGAEALVRWQRDDGTFVSPGDFIPLFEKNGMIREFDEYIFRHVCEQQRKWQMSGKALVPVSVNLSRVSLYYNKVVSVYKTISEEIGVDKVYLPIEITESAAITNNEIKEIAEEFYKAGFSLHMDDFGSGYSSLATLNILHFDTLKLDKSLIDFIGNFGGERLIEHTVLLAKELGMHITAEGVEDEKQVVFLRHLGCDNIQGYFYSKPIPVEKFELLLDKLLIQDYTEEVDFVSSHINSFKNSVNKSPLYSFSVNLTKDTFYENNGICDWTEETATQFSKYSDALEYVTKNYILDEYKKGYHDFFDRNILLEKDNSGDEARVYHYKRLYKGEATKMRVVSNLFKIPNSDDVWMFMAVTII